MLSLSERIKSIDIVPVAESIGVELRKQGSRHVGLCPIHSEKFGSFTIKDNRFSCYGCGAYGDTVDLIQQYYGISFLDACKHLGLELENPKSGEYKKAVAEARRKQAKRKRRQQRERELAFTLGTMIRRTHVALKALTPENISEHGGILEMLPWWEWGHETLIHGDKTDRAYVLWSFKGFPAIKRGKLFDDDLY